MNTQIVSSHPMLDYLVKLAPFIQDAIPFGAMVGVTDTEKFLLYLPTENLNLGEITGMTIPEGDAIYEAIKTNKTQMITVPKKAFGIPFKAKGVPIKDDEGRIIGGLGIGVSLVGQEKLTEMAKQFTATAEELSVSTEELSSSSQELTHFMINLNKSQQEMIEQVNKTEKMLGLIGSIGRNSRILGLNAGIEAARSGEHGRGFGVVAQEITKLADTSTSSVDEIRNLLELLRAKVEEVSKTVSETTTISQQQSASTEQISAVITHLTIAAEEIDELSNII